MAQRKKIRIIFVSLFMILLCSSCSFLREAQLTSLMSEEGEKIEKQSNEIIRCLTESDRAGFESLFAEEIRNRESFQQEVDAVFDFFECDTYSKAEIETTASGGDSTRSGEKVSWYVIPEIVYINTLVNTDDSAAPIDSKYYHVNYYWQITDKEYPDLEGIHYLSISLLNIEGSVTVGTKEFAE